ncbi:hypothetical protein ACJIZ3_025153 [Penstemon smallii]|uniref:GCK domain-containing protein n=1 Tax=Penstemon smallii TaxID=265156 RepID=A0ABD3TWG3_9LAMI
MSSSDFSRPREESPVKESTTPPTNTNDSVNQETETLLQKDSGEPKTPNQESSDPPKSAETQENSAEKVILSEEDLENSIREGDFDDEEEEEEGECGFCLFMKGGGCKDTFIEWEKCVEEGEKNKEDIVEKCFQATSALKKCMEVHSDYYAPLLQAEKAAEEEAVKQLEEEKAKSSGQEGGGEESGKKEKEEALDGSEKKEGV